MHLSPQVAKAAVHSKVVVLLFGVLPICCGALCLPLLYCALICVLSSFAIILKRKGVLLALLLSSYGYLVTVNVL